jgi:hypothetical protein
MTTATLPAADRTVDPYDPSATAETFDLDGWLAGIPWDDITHEPRSSAQRKASQSALRIELTKYDPLLFAVLMFPHHLRDDDGRFSLADAHLEWVRLALQWAKPVTRPQEQRHAFLAPRGCGKSTWWLLILPMWAAAHGWKKFAAAFADSAPQAEMHLATFRRELQTNGALRRDFPDLCVWGKRPRNTGETDTKAMYTARSGFTFAAKGIDSSSLGMKVGAQRPDLLLLDDIEPDESSYSAYQMHKRLTTVVDAVLPLNVRASVVLSGTVTMPGSITHQLVKHGKGELDPDDRDTQWIDAEQFTVHHHLPIIERADGTERSMWPAKWPLDYLQQIRHTRSYRKNFLNDPHAVDSDYWTEADITYDRFPVSRTYLSIDGAVTTKKTSDYTGLAVVSWAPPVKDDKGRVTQPARCLVEFALAVKLKGAALREKVLSVLDAYPWIGAILVETNQGGDLWEETLHHMPVKVIPVRNEDHKETRAGRVHTLYQLVPPRVVHAERMPALEDQMIGFPKGPNDDLVDAVGTAVLRFLKPPKRDLPPSVSSQTYLS